MRTTDGSIHEFLTEVGHICNKLNHFHISDSSEIDGMIEVIRSNPVTHLCIPSHRGILYHQLLKVLDACPNLEELFVAFRVGIPAQLCDKLKHLKSFSSFVIRPVPIELFMNLTDESAQKLVSLQLFSLSYTDPITEAAIIVICTKMINLKFLGLEYKGDQLDLFDSKLYKLIELEVYDQKSTTLFESIIKKSTNLRMVTLCLPDDKHIKLLTTYCPDITTLRIPDPGRRRIHRYYENIFHILEDLRKIETLIVEDRVKHIEKVIAVLLCLPNSIKHLKLELRNSEQKLICWAHYLNNFAKLHPHLRITLSFLLYGHETELIESEAKNFQIISKNKMTSYKYSFYGDEEIFHVDDDPGAVGNGNAMGGVNLNSSSSSGNGPDDPDLEMDIAELEEAEPAPLDEEPAVAGEPEVNNQQQNNQQEEPLQQTIPLFLNYIVLIFPYLVLIIYLTLYFIMNVLK